MKKLLIVLVVLLSFHSKVRTQCTSDTISNDIIMLVDNSASINNAEFGSFSNIILSTINRIAADCPLSRRGVVHYGGAFGQSVNIEHQLSSTATINSISRQYCLNATCNDGGDDLNYAMGELIRMINNNELQLNPENRLSIVVFTDAFSDSFCSTPNCSVTLPTTNVDILKSNYGANVSVIGMSSDARPEYLAISASPGGTYTETALNSACNSSIDGCTLPRQYIPIEFTDNPLTVGAQVAALVSCQANIVSTANVNAGEDQTICSDRGESASLMAVPVSGQAPFTYSWSNNLDSSQSVTVTPAVTTTFTVTITDDNGCQGTDQVTVQVQTCGPDCADDTIYNDVIFMIDNSRSIDNSEFASFENIILTSLAGVRTQCPTSRRALVHYGGAFGREVNIEYPLGSVSQITSVNRQFCLNATCNDGGDDLNYAMGELITLINDGSLARDPNNKLSIVLFTDAFNDNACATNPNCSTSLPTTNVDILKDAYGATVTVIGISEQATPSTLALSASPGGSFMNVALDNSCSTTFDGCTLPRKYIPVSFTTSPQLVSDSLQACIVCQAIVQPKVEVDAGPDQTFCENLNETATVNLIVMNGQEPIKYKWDNNQGTNASITVSPPAPTTYHVTVTDANMCETIDSVTITPIQCNDCFAEAGIPLPHKEVCLDNGRAIITTEDNIGVNIPQGYEKVYVLTDHELTIVDYAINNGIFIVDEAGVYRVHTLVAEVNNANDEDYFDINLIKRGISNLFLIANCIVDHNICADFDFPGRVHVILPPGDMMCMTFENTINLCSDGIDNDSDGLVDCADEDCKDLVPCLENTLIACNDLYDNDGDGLVDCFDSDCWEFIRCFEREENCKDGIDNDGDGLIDCEDDSCFGSAECMEDSPYTCKDGLDNDRDGLIDCAEASCQAFIVCSEWGSEACSDGIDNDFDGLVDCADADCRTSFSSNCGAIESSPAFCSDGIDNDADGLVDCADPDCGVTAINVTDITAATTQINATCPSNNNGSISIDLNQTGWEYSINGGESFGTATVFENLSMGDYLISLRRASGCTLDGPTITIAGEQCPEICENGIDDDGDGAIDCADPDCGLVEALEAIVTDPVCPQVDNGSVRLFFLSGGNTAGIEYSKDGTTWQNDPIFRNLIGGTYNIQLRTNKGCTASKTYILTTPDCPEVCNNGLDDDRDGFIDCADTDCGISLVTSDVTVGELSCPSKNDGTITVAHSQTGLQYKIDDNPLQDAATFENLTAGSYLLTVINGSGCQDTLRVSIADVDCSEICDNGIDDDGNGLTDCEDPACSVGLDPVITAQDATCPLNDNGTVSVSIDTTGLTFALNDGTFQSSGNFDNLVPGSYTLTILNANGCSTTQIVEIAGVTCTEDCTNGIDDDGNGLVDCDDGACTTGINATATSTGAICPDNNNGTIRVENQQGSMEYSLNGETFQSVGLFENLNPGNYVLTIKNANDCSTVQSITVEGETCFEICDNGIDDDGNGLIDCEDGDCSNTENIEIIKVDPTCPIGNNGSIEVRGVTDANVMYSLSGAPRQVSNKFEGLEGNFYAVFIFYGNGCLDSIGVTLPMIECSEICDNGIDDDGNGLIDCEDGACSSQSISFMGQDEVEDTYTYSIQSEVDKVNGSLEILSLKGFNAQPQNGGFFETKSIYLNFPEVNNITSSIQRARLKLSVIDRDTILDPSNTLRIMGIEHAWDENSLSITNDPFQEDNYIDYHDIKIENDVLELDVTRVLNHILNDQRPKYLVDGKRPFLGLLITYIDAGKDEFINFHSSETQSSGKSPELILDASSSLSLNNDIQVTNATCPLNNNGSIKVLIEDSNLMFSLNDITYSSNTLFDSLDVGIYTLYVKSIFGCLTTVDFEILGESACTEICDNGIDDDGNGMIDCEDGACNSGLEVINTPDKIMITPPSCSYASDGSIEILTNTGFQYSLDDTLYKASVIMKNLEIGTYNIFVRNTFGCVLTVSIDLNIAPYTGTEICDNGIDDDGDGLIDCLDDECGIEDYHPTIFSGPLSPKDNLEHELTVYHASCSNKLGSAYIEERIPCALYSLDGLPYQIEPFFDSLSEGEHIVHIIFPSGCVEEHLYIDVLVEECIEECGDSIDNDLDGTVDCADSDCFTFPQDIVRIKMSSDLGFDTYESGVIGERQTSFWKEPELKFEVGITDRDTGYRNEKNILLYFPLRDYFESDSVEIESAVLSLSVIDDSNYIQSENNQVILYSTAGRLDENTTKEERSGLHWSSESAAPLNVRNGKMDINITSIAKYILKDHIYGVSENIYLIQNPLNQNSALSFASLENPNQLLTPELIIKLKSSTTIDSILEIKHSNCGSGGVINIIESEDSWTYSLDNITYTPDTSFVNLAVGTYTIYIKNEFNCTISSQFEIQETCTIEICDNGIDDDGDGLIDCEDGNCSSFTNMIIAANPPSCIDENDGTIVIVDGLDGYQYSLSGSAFQLSNTFDGLSIGEYLLTIRNNNGCDTTITTTLGTEVVCPQMSEGFFAPLLTEIKVFLEGAFDPNSGNMATQLNEQGYLPGQLPVTYFGKSTPAGQPYNQAPWFYEGTEGSQMTDSRDRLQSAYNATVVDWILLSLRTDLTKGSEVFQGAGLLHSDGTVEMQRFTQLDEDITEYYIVIEHRNHLPIMSPTPIPVVQGILSFDFTKKDSYRSIIGTGQINYDGSYMMAAGNGEMTLDYSSDTDINVKDLTAWLFNNGENSSYYLEDYDLNGDINIKDRILWEKNNGIFSPLKTK